MRFAILAYIAMVLPIAACAQEQAAQEVVTVQSAEADLVNLLEETIAKVQTDKNDSHLRELRSILQQIDGASFSETTQVRLNELTNTAQGIVFKTAQLSDVNADHSRNESENSALQVKAQVTTIDQLLENVRQNASTEREIIRLPAGLTLSEYRALLQKKDNLGLLMGSDTTTEPVSYTHLTLPTTPYV